MFIKRLAPGVYDVFIGTGWDNWTRVRRAKDHIRILAGRHLNPGVIKQLEERFSRK